MDCTKTTNFFKEFRKMCKNMKDCRECSFGNNGNNCCPIHSDFFTQSYIQTAITIVQDWSDKHPLKTYVQDFFEKFPNAPRNNKELPLACRDKIYGHVSDSHCNGYCNDCWNEPMEEE